MVSAALLQSRSVLSIVGADAASFLQNLVTQDVDTLAEGQAAFTALLTPQGKILFDFFIARGSAGYLLDCEAQSADSLAKRLTLYRLRAKVTIERTENAVVAVWGEPPPCGKALDAGVSFVDPRLEALGERSITSPAAAPALLGQNGASEADYDAHRICLGAPEFGKDFGGEEMFLLDVDYDALHGVSYTKGCFIGQEVSSRMKRKGEIRRRTLTLAFEGAPPAKGTPITAGGSGLGEILSGADGRALALIRLDRLAAAIAAGAPVEAAGRPVSISVPAWLEPG